MNADTKYVVRPYTSADNAGLAVMWNESDDQWPGTFTRGVPFTAERIRKWFEQETCLMQLVVEDTLTGAIVGFGNLWVNAVRADTCYVALLNVHPAHQKHSLARRMLTQMIDWATAHGYQRVTINTWPANIKSVPLYKKVGFAWVPDMNVFMENYIPMIRQLDLAQDFFARHDWYTTFKRQLDQEEDDQRHPATDAMNVFVFRWEEGGEFLEVVIDRYVQAITGIETAEFSAYAVAADSEPAQGFAYPMRWHVTNKLAIPLDVSILAEGEDGIHLTYQAACTLAQHEIYKAEANLVCAADAPKLKFGKRDRNKTAPKVATKLVLGRHSATAAQQHVVAFGTGLYYREAVTHQLEPEYPVLLPGQEQIVHLVLRNRAGRRIQGLVSISPQPGLTTDWRRHDFEIEADEFAGIPLKVTCNQTGALPLQLRTTITSEAQPIAIAPKTLPLLAMPVGGVAIAANPDDEYVAAANDCFQVVCHARGGFFSIANTALKRGQVHIFEEAGPPFQPFDLRERLYAQSSEHGPGWAKISTVVESERFPGLSIIRDITITASPVVKIEYRLVNNGAVAHETQIRPAFMLASWDREIGTVALPRKEGLIVARASEFPTTHGDLPEEPENMAEQWLAFSREGQTFGLIWGRDVVKHEFWFQGGPLLFSEKQALEPQCLRAIAPMYVYCGPGDWRDVRRFWQRLNNKPLDYIDSLPATEPPYTLKICPSPLITLTNTIDAQFCFENVRLQQVDGQVVIEPPEGWTIDQPEIAIDGVNRDRPLTVPLRLTGQTDRVGAFSGRVHLHSRLRDEVSALTILRLGNGSLVTIETAQRAEQPVWIINNGRCEWAIAPEFHAGVIAWHDITRQGRSPNHLFSAFPETGNLGWLRPWLGGIWPTLLLENEGPNWPGKLHEETFTVEPLTEDLSDGISWQGLRLSSGLTQESFKGLRAAIDYLTVGGSNVLKLVFRVMNTSNAPRRLTPGFWVFTQVDGDHQCSDLYADELQRRRQASEMCWSRVGSWGAIVNPETQRALTLVSGCGDTLMGVMDWGKDGAHFCYDDVFTVPPSESRAIVGYLALTDSLAEARHYEALKHILRPF